MTPTICAPFRPTSFPHTMDYNPNSNQAGSPLPSIPRRTSSSRSAHSHSISEPTLSSFTTTHAPAMLIVHPPTPPPDSRLLSISLRASPDPVEQDSDSSLSSTQSNESQPTIMVRSRKAHGQRSPSMSPRECTPTPSAKKMVPGSSNRESTVRSSLATGSPLSVGDISDNDTPRASRTGLTQKQLSSGKLGRPRLNIETPLHGRHVSESHIHNVSAESPSQHRIKSPATASAIVQSSSSSSTESRHMRTKSGQPIKSSLKSAKRPPGLTVAIGNVTSKSEPNTPTHSKAVHFDAQLEHVKLFLAEQKPLAVSRDGSPTDTSGTESEFPSFIYGNPDEERTKVLIMQVANMPTKINTNADVALLELALSQDAASIQGRVRVKNIAFEKWLAVRFTFDSWQTTSEVTAKYVESIPHNTFDIFAFTIRLNDIMARIEEKCLYLALRYTVAGKEIWDNNGGQNYMAKFTKTTVQSQKMVSDDGEVPIANGIHHLNNKLEQVAESRLHTAFFLAERIHHQARLEAEKLPTLRAEKSLSARYDLSASLKNNPRIPGGSSPPSGHHRTNTFPASNSIPWPQKMFSAGRGRSSPAEPRSPHTSVLGSPGLDTILRPCPPPADVDDVPFQIPPPSRREGRNHQRGYFDRNTLDSADTKKTPPGSPILSKRTDNLFSTPVSNSAQLPRYNSFPPTDSSRTSSPYSSPTPASFVPVWATAQLMPTSGSEASTPSISSGSSSSRSTSPSPTEEFRHIMMSKRGDNEVSESPDSYNGRDHYSSLLNRFCFYTGNGDSLLDVPSDEIPRSRSTSSIEEFLFQSPPTNTFAPDCASPVRTPTRMSPSFDETHCRSGSSTPTAGSFAMESCSTTSIMT